MNQFVSKKEKVQFEMSLKDITKKGVQLYIDGKPSSPKEVANKHYVSEEQVYMPDLIISDCGKWIEMHFHKVLS